MTDPKTMEKLVKLLELSKRGDEHEAQVAAQRAAELMAKHQIDAIEVESHMGRAELPPNPETGRLDDEPNAPMGKRLQAWQLELGITVAHNLGGRMYYSSGAQRFTFTMIGPPNAVSAARYLYMALEKEVDRLGRREMRERDESNAWRRAYCKGMVMRIGSRLREGRHSAMAQASSTALVAVSRMEKAIDDTYKSMDLRERSLGGNLKREEGVAEGWRDGAHLDLSDTDRKGLGEGHKKLTSG